MGMVHLSTSMNSRMASSPKDLLMVASDERNGLKALLIDAVEVAAKRSGELGSDHKG